ncbi:hypothetical protein GCM10022233_73740 [Streptomyces shaanxiensis]|uniref:Uncharacterized protein n=1 Tax=Streptomyces shaanxiensis TaxID=653357 RepID=A0ABP7W620_9ACTN
MGDKAFPTAVDRIRAEFAAVLSVGHSVNDISRPGPHPLTWRRHDRGTMLRGTDTFSFEVL